MTNDNDVQARIEEAIDRGARTNNVSIRDPPGSGGDVFHLRVEGQCDDTVFQALRDLDLIVIGVTNRGERTAVHVTKAQL